MNGVTVLAFENVEDNPKAPNLQFLGEFTFLLCRLSEKSIASLHDGIRTVEIGMVCNIDGSLVVSIYDSNDPEDVAKLIKYKKSLGIEDEEMFENDINKHVSDKITSKEQLLLGLCLFFVVVLYISVKIAFHQVKEPKIDKVL